MKKLSLPILIIAIGLFAACSTENTAVATEVIVYKESTCRCCDKWVDHLEHEGFKVKAENRDGEMSQIKAEHGVTPRLKSCHTAIVDGYVIEGHVPASDIKRLLKEKPTDIAGLTAPGMPKKSPGMQAEGLPPEDYNIISFTNSGSTKVFTRY